MTQFYKMQALARLTDTHVETIRYYEKTGLLPAPQRAANGYRLFDQRAADTLKFIKAARAIGFSIDDIRQLLQLQQNPKGDCTEADEIAGKHLAATEAKIAQLLEVKKFLQAVQRCDSHEVATCTILNRLSEEAAHNGT